MTVLRQVLNAFESASEPVSLNQLARNLDIEPGMLECMVQHWVRKGKLRVSAGPSAAGCPSCGVKGDCPFVMALPRSYEVVSEETPEPEIHAPCACCG